MANQAMLNQMEELFKVSEHVEDTFVDVLEGDNIGTISAVKPFQSQKGEWFIKVDIRNDRGVMSSFLGNMKLDTGTISYIDRFNSLCVTLGLFKRGDTNKPTMEECFKNLIGMEVNLFGKKSTKPTSEGKFPIYGNIRIVK